VRGRTAGGHVFLDSVAEEMEVVLGHGAVMGLQLAALKLRRGARAVVLCGAGMGYAEGREPPGVAKGEDLYFQVEVVRFESEPNLHEMDVAQRVAFAEERRVIGKECFVMHRVRSALRQYDKGLLALQGPEAALGGGGNGREEEPDEAVLAHAQGRALLVTLLVNASLCHLRLKDYAATRHMASRALALEPRNAKALLRRGQALAALADAEGAQRDFRAALELVGDEETREKIRAALVRAGCEIASVACADRQHLPRRRAPRPRSSRPRRASGARWAGSSRAPSCTRIAPCPSPSPRSARASPTRCVASARAPRGLCGGESSSERVSVLRRKRMRLVPPS
jgi:tetratricopeptide (TPR) repeat protein